MLICTIMMFLSFLPLPQTTWSFATFWNFLPCHRLRAHSERSGIVASVPADHVITPENVFEAMEEDVVAADMVLWVGISFEQSASTQYFRNVRRFLQVRLPCAGFGRPRRLPYSGALGHLAHVMALWAAVLENYWFELVYGIQCNRRYSV
jgi:hypothetical protein